MGSTVLVTGVSRRLSGRFAAALAATAGVERVIAVDVVTPSADLGRAEFVRADIRNPVVARIMSQASVDTVVHTSVGTSAHRIGARVAQKETNVLGTMQLLAACQATPSVKRLVVKSTGAVYGSSPRDPVLFTEEMSLRTTSSSGYVKDALEVEGYVRGVRRRRPDIDVCVLRMTHVVGPNVETALTDYFRRPLAPIPFGYDARLQLLHEDDAVDALLVAARGAATGVFNVAGDGIVTLTQALAVMRRVPLPIMTPRGPLWGRAIRRTRWAEASGEPFDFLLWGRGLDTTRMRDVLQFEPAYTTRAALEDFAWHLGGPLPDLGAWVAPVLGPAAHMVSPAARLAGPVVGPLADAVSGPASRLATGAARRLLSHLAQRTKEGDPR